MQSCNRCILCLDFRLVGSTETAVGSPGLRELKKERTRTAISEAARELFESQGFAATTIPQIAARAQVSPRTVSYYFPAKEELVFPDRAELLGALEAALSQRLEGESAGEAVARWLTTNFVERSAAVEERERCRRCMVDDDPGLRAYELEMQSRAEEIIAASFAADLALPVEHHVPRMIAAATTAALHSLDVEDEQPGPGRGKALIEDVMSFINAGARQFDAG